MLKLEALHAFISIAETRSITQTAQRLGLSKSVISDRLSDLEDTLGARLIQRSTRRLALTGEGAIFLERARGILREADAAVSEVAERRGELAGRIRLSAPVSFGTLHLGPALFGFLKEHPAVRLDLDLNDRFVDPLADGFDAVIRHGPIDDRRIIVKRLAVSRRFLVASKEYLARCGTPRTVQELVQHQGIVYTYRGAIDWCFRVGRSRATVRPRAAFTVNNGLLMRDAAIAGMGIALLPTFLLADAFVTRALELVDVGAEAQGATVYLAYPDHLRASGKLRALAAWLKGAFGEPAYWDRAIPRGHVAIR